MRNRTRRRAILLTVLALALGACNTMRFEVADGPTGAEIRDRKAYFLWGLTPAIREDMREHCPAGVAQIREQTTFGDGALSIVTLGIYSPRTSHYTCLEETKR